MIAPVPIIVDNDGIVFDRWASWSAKRRGVGLFTIVETPPVGCWGCSGQGFRIYECAEGFQRLPCPTCWGDRELPGQVFVVLLEWRGEG